MDPRQPSPLRIAVNGGGAAVVDSSMTPNWDLESPMPTAPYAAAAAGIAAATSSSAAAAAAAAGTPAKMPWTPTGANGGMGIGMGIADDQLGELDMEWADGGQGWLQTAFLDALENVPGVEDDACTTAAVPETPNLYAEVTGRQSSSISNSGALPPAGAPAPAPPTAAAAAAASASAKRPLKRQRLASTSDKHLPAPTGAFGVPVLAVGYGTNSSVSGDGVASTADPPQWADLTLDGISGTMRQAGDTGAPLPPPPPPPAASSLSSPFAFTSSAGFLSSSRVAAEGLGAPAGAPAPAQLLPLLPTTLAASPTATTAAAVASSPMPATGMSKHHMSTRGKHRAKRPAASQDDDIAASPAATPPVAAIATGARSRRRSRAPGTGGLGVGKGPRSAYGKPPRASGTRSRGRGSGGGSVGSKARRGGKRSTASVVSRSTRADSVNSSTSSMAALDSHIAQLPGATKHGLINRHDHLTAGSPDEHDERLIPQCGACEQVLIDVGSLRVRKKRVADECRVRGCTIAGAARAPFMCTYHNDVGQIYTVTPARDVDFLPAGKNLPKIKLCNRCHRWEWLPNYTNRGGKYNLTCKACCGKANYRHRSAGSVLMTINVALDGRVLGTVSVDVDTTLTECRQRVIPDARFMPNVLYSFTRAGGSRVERDGEARLKAKDCCAGNAGAIKGKSGSKRGASKYRNAAAAAAANGKPKLTLNLLSQGRPAFVNESRSDVGPCPSVSFSASAAGGGDAASFYGAQTVPVARPGAGSPSEVAFPLPGSVGPVGGALAEVTGDPDDDGMGAIDEEEEEAGSVGGGSEAAAGRRGNITTIASTRCVGALWAPAAKCEATLMEQGVLAQRERRTGNACRVTGCIGTAMADPFLCAYHIQDTVFLATLPKLPHSPRVFVRLCRCDRRWEWLASFTVGPRCRPHRREWEAAARVRARRAAGKGDSDSTSGSADDDDADDDDDNTGDSVGAADAISVAARTMVPHRRTSRRRRTAAAAGAAGTGAATAAGATGGKVAAAPPRTGLKRERADSSEQGLETTGAAGSGTSGGAALPLLAESLTRAFENFVGSLGVDGQAAVKDVPLPRDGSTVAFHAFCTALFQSMRRANEHPTVRGHLDGISALRTVWEECAGDNGFTLVHFATAVGCSKVLDAIDEYVVEQTLLQDQADNGIGYGDDEEDADMGRTDQATAAAAAAAAGNDDVGSTTGVADDKSECGFGRDESTTASGTGHVAGAAGVVACAGAGAGAGTGGAADAHQHHNHHHSGIRALTNKVFVRAASLGSLAVVRKALERGLAVNCVFSSRVPFTPLMAACRCGHSDVVEHLLQHGADTEMRGQDGQTALVLAARNNHLKVVKQLLGHGADVNAIDMYGYSALMRASRGGNLTSVKALAEAGATVDLAAKHNGSRALLWAAIKGYSQIAQYLLERGADPLATNAFGEQPLHWARYHRHHGIVSLLEKHIAIRKDQQKESAEAQQQPQQPQRSSGRSTRARSKKGATVADSSKSGDSLVASLMWAASQGNTDSVRDILGKGADVNSQQHGYTPLMAAARGGWHECVQFLIGRGAAVNMKSPDNQTALILAANCAYIEVVQLLVEAGADVNACDNYGSVLLRAARNGHAKVVEYLVARGADVNAAGEFNSFTALQFAALNGNLAMTRFLVEAGAHVGATNMFGETALHWARMREHDDVVVYLQKAMAKAGLGHRGGFGVRAGGAMGDALAAESHGAAVCTMDLD